MLCSHLVASFVCIIIHQHLFSISAESIFFKSELALKSDLMDYLNTIDRVSQYYTKNKNDIYIDLCFGLFLTIGKTFQVINN